jgi:PhzF family phenazine biosynthesis protein
VTHTPSAAVRRRPFAQVDVFTTEPYRGNPLAVVCEADGLSSEQMQRFAN